jgi:hypothetical protein
MWDQDTGDSVGKSVSESKAVYDDAIASGVNNMLVLNHEVYGVFRRFLFSLGRLSTPP